ncbi:MAG: sn-glycerol-3-phosphate ABC transporter ATP-binding protein UgpC [Proteobacteria bacterium]|nr:sn-glycerol-3-phosphate ABC transporter ATP-binding protein UgpC [Pseudomonadota bacterium]
MAGLTLKSIVKRYGNAEPTLKGIDLDIRDGEFLVLVGPSGCGKSTLLRTIAGLESITSGELYIGDRLVNDVHPKDRDIAMVFQSYALYPHMTIRRNMAFGLEVRKMPKEEIDKLVAEASAMLGLDDFLDKLPKELSGGQRQRVAMGRAIVRRPQVFLFDEPLSNLDAALRTQMRVEIRRLHRKLKTTIIYVTHDQVEAMTLADRIAVLSGRDKENGTKNAGYLQQVGSPLELFQRPVNKFVAGFIGSPSMNFLDAEIVESGGRLCVKVNGNEIALDDACAKAVFKGQDVCLGIRPQNVVLADDEHPANLKVKVDVIETLGWESHVHFMLGGDHFLAVLEAQKVSGFKENQEVGLYVAPGVVHLFERDGAGKAIAHGEMDDAEVAAKISLSKGDAASRMVSAEASSEAESE